MEDRKNFGSFICQRRKELGLTQREFAQRLFVTDSAVSKWERGLAYPDITLLQSICQVLQCSEKELLSASEDTEGRRIAQLAQKHLRLIRDYRLAHYILFGIITGACFVGNLVAAHGLTWFWIVLAGEALTASLTLLPAFLPDQWRGPGTLGGFVAALLILLLVCCLYTGETWFPVAAVGALFGIGLVFLPLVLRVLPLREPLANRKTLLYVGAELALLILLYGVCCLSAGGSWFVSAALWTVFGVGLCLLPPLRKQIPLPEPLGHHKALVWLAFQSVLLLAGVLWECRPAPAVPLFTTAFCLTLPWGWLGALRYLPAGRWFRSAAAFAWTGVWVWFMPWALDRILLLGGEPIRHLWPFIPPVNFANWTDPAVLNANVILMTLLGFLLLALVCTVMGVRWRRRRHIPEP